MREYDKALDEFLRAIFLDPNYAKAYNNIGVVYFMQKNYAEVSTRPGFFEKYKAKKATMEKLMHEWEKLEEELESIN